MIKEFIKEHKKELLLLLITIILCSLFLEVFVRVYYFSPLALSPYEGNHLIHLLHSGYIKPSKNCEIIYELKPNIDSSYKLKDFKTNSQGLRDKEYSLEKPNNTYRVVVLGDSLTLPSGVEIDSAYHSILEEEFNKEDSSKTYEFINFGVGGYKLNQYLSTLKYRGLDYNPDHVIVGICLTNDIPLKSENHIDCDYELEGTINTYLFPMSLFVMYSKVRAIIDYDNKKEKMNELDIKYLDSLIKEFKEVSDDNNFNITFVALRRTSNEDMARLEILRNISNKYKIPLIDTSTEFKDDGENYWIYRYDHHPNNEANQIFAEAIKKQIKL